MYAKIFVPLQSILWATEKLTSKNILFGKKSIEQVDSAALDEKSNVLTGLVYGAINIEVELQQNIVTYNVTFLDWDATVLFVEKVEEGKDAKGPDTNPEREGYTFIGWAPDITNVTSDRTVIAQYEKNDPTALDDIQSDKLQCTKLLRDGVLYLKYNGTTYDVQGRRIEN